MCLLWCALHDIARLKIESFLATLYKFCIGVFFQFGKKTFEWHIQRHAYWRNCHNSQDLACIQLNITYRYQHKYTHKNVQFVYRCACSQSTLNVIIFVVVDVHFYSCYVPRMVFCILEAEQLVVCAVLNQFYVSLLSTIRIRIVCRFVIICVTYFVFSFLAVFKLFVIRTVPQFPR